MAVPQAPGAVARVVSFKMKKMKNLLLIFTRNPQFGKVKTRLAEGLGKEVTLQLYEFLLKHTAEVTKDLTCQKRVFYSEFIEEKDVFEGDFQKGVQKGEDLGERMMQAFAEGFEDGFENIIIIGSDLFDLQKKDLESAFSRLQQADVVLGPAEDGGYYLLGMKKLNPLVFRNKKWGSNSVFKETVEDLEEENIAILEIKNDIDNFEDLKNEPRLLDFVRRREQINFDL